MAYQRIETKPFILSILNIFAQKRYQPWPIRKNFIID